VIDDPNGSTTEPIATPEYDDDEAVRLAITSAFGADALELLEEEDESPLLADRASTPVEPPSPSALDQLIARIDAEFAPASSSSAGVVNRPDTARRAKFIVFVLAETSLAVPLQDVLEIHRMPRITPIPNVPGWILGVTNLRGDILSVVDLRGLLGLGASPSERSGLIMVVRSRDHELTTALVVDRVPGMVNLDPDRFSMPTSGLDGPIAQYLRGVAEDRDRLLALIDLDALLRSPEMRQFQIA
jgi:purine-binding chemotaxis protein CheW